MREGGREREKERAKERQTEREKEREDKFIFGNRFLFFTIIYLSVPRHSTSGHK